MGCSCSVTPCACSKTFTQVGPATLQNSLAASLTCAVDSVRDLYTSLGVRNYRVSLVWTRWSGGERGVGAEYVVCEETILPTPLVSDLKALQVEVSEIGSDEDGQITVSQISPRYTELTLMGQGKLSAPGEEIPEDVQFYWEIFYPQKDGGGLRRRMTPKSAPNYHATKFEWTINLLKQEDNRTAAGDVA